MADCINEITGVQTISLYPSDSVRLVRPDISNENEVNLISDGEDSYTISDPVLLPKWERVVGYSGNYKQNYSDEFTFLAFGIENEIPAIIKELRNTRVGYVANILTIGNSNYVFQSPVFLNNANTKRIDSHSWQISLSYRIPSFLDKLTNLETILGTASEVLPCDKEIQGIKSISLYTNENITYNYPDLSNENEVDVIVLEDAFLVIDQVKELPKWERIINYSENYKQNYNDEFAFLLHGIENDIPETIKTLRNNRLGYIAVITTTSNQDYIFPTPIFLNENNTKQVDSHSWAVSLAYRVPSFEDKLTLLSISLFGILIDPDARAYLEAMGIPNDETIYYESTPQEITGAEMWTAANTFILGWKSAGLWTISKALYLFIGGTLSTHKYNAKDPRDLDAAFRLFWHGGVALSGAHTGTGVKPNGTNAYAETYVNLLSHLPTDSMSLSYYSRENINTSNQQMDMGAVLDVATDGIWLATQYDQGAFNNRFLAVNSRFANLANTENLDARGLYDCSKTSNGTNTFKTHKNGVVQDTLNGIGTNVDLQVYLFALNDNGSDVSPTNRECAFAGIYEGITDAQSADGYTLVQALQTALHRQV